MKNCCTVFCNSYYALSFPFSLLFSGSEGKLSVIDQRLAMLAGVGNMSYNTVSGTSSVQSLSEEVATMFIPILQQEGKTQ